MFVYSVQLHYTTTSLRPYLSCEYSFLRFTLLFFSSLSQSTSVESLFSLMSSHLPLGLMDTFLKFEPSLQFPSFPSILLTSFFLCTLSEGVCNCHFLLSYILDTAVFLEYLGGIICLELSLHQSILSVLHKTLTLSLTFFIFLFYVLVFNYI